MTDQFFFSGSFDSKIDDKNRFVMPQSFRYGLVENGSLEFAIGLGIGGCLSIYKKSDVLKIVEKFRKNQHLAKYRRFFTLFFSTLHHSSCDKLGRVLLPSRLKETINIKKEIIIAGVLDKIEIWPKENYLNEINELTSKDNKGQLEQLIEDAFSLLHDDEREVNA